MWSPSRLSHDVRLALRTLSRSPGFTAAVVATLALGIGGNAAIFSLVETVLLRPLPYLEPERLVRVYTLLPDGRSNSSAPDFVDMRRDNRSFEEMTALDTTSFALRLPEGAERVRGARVTAGFFDVFGMRPAPGRGFLPSDEAAETAAGAGRVAVIADGLWRERFGADPGIVGRTLTLDGEPYTVVGVAPPGFEYPEEARIWALLAFTPEELAGGRGSNWLQVYGRLASGTSAERVLARGLEQALEQANTELRTIAAALAARFPQTNTGTGVEVVPLREALVGEVRPALLMLSVAVGLVLLVACANIANLLLARAVGREREIAIRSALGAGRSRVVGEMVVESLLLALAGGAAGLLLAIWGTELLASLGPQDVPRLAEARVGGAAVVFTLAVSLLTGLAFGLLPAVQAASAADLAGRLKAGGRDLGGDSRGARARSFLVVAEVALCATLLGGAGLLVRSFWELSRVDPGFEPGGLLTFNLALPAAYEEELPRAAAFYQEVTRRILALPGVAAAGAVYGLPLSGTDFEISLYDLDGVRQEDPVNTPDVQVRLITPGYLQAMGIRLLAGRDISDADREGTPPIVLVDRAAARLLFPGRNPLGHRLTLEARFDAERAGGEVVGLVGDVRDDSLGADPRPVVYVAHAQNPTTFMSFAVRARSDPAALAPAARAAVAALDPEAPVYRVRTMEEMVAESVARPRFTMLLVGAFAAVGLALAAVGVYGVLAYAVGRRTREIGLRMAIGARPASVLALVLGRAARLTAAGLAAGLAGAYGAGRLLAGQLFAVGPADPGTLAAVALVLAAAAALASYLPARRAVRVDPLTALRSE